MANKVRLIVQQAKKTFKLAETNNINLAETPEFQTLTTLVNGLSASDLDFPPKFLDKHGSIRLRSTIDHFSVHKDYSVEVGVFIMKQGSKLPLHDHPGMHGIIKVIHGSVRITSYNILQTPKSSNSSSLYYSQPLETSKNPPVLLSGSDESSILTPTISNIHEVVCTNGPAAFLDILAPPYDNDDRDCAERSCHYFREDSTSYPVRLYQIPNPGDYWSYQDVNNQL